MKSTMPFLGVTLPATRAIAKGVLRDSGETDPGVLIDLALELWDEASHREERYAALAVLSARSLRADPALMPVIEHTVRTGRWWDFTDELAHRLTELLDAHPAEITPIVKAWSTDDDLWMRRIAIISQLGRRDRVDTGLLGDVIGPNLADDEFFIRKAIGWALRDFARTDPDWVRRFAASQPLSALSRREALKHL